jgi:eukaryotic-like serine/threonine-protein kinase
MAKNELPPARPAAQVSLAELLDQQKNRWRMGQRAPVEDYLQASSTPFDVDEVLDLIYNEVMLREEDGDRPLLEEYVCRFPHLADALAMQFEVDRALDETPVGDSIGLLHASTPNVASAATPHSHQPKLPKSAEPQNDSAVAQDDPYATSNSPHPASAAYHPNETAGEMIGPYKLLQKLGKGGMGVVWMAEQREPVHRNVAVKIIKAALHGEQVIARFEAERQALAMMDHPNIAKVLDVGTTAVGGPYFVMELVKGISFTQYCDQEKLTLNERLDLFIPVCNAVQHAHQKGVVHRDLKPSNVLIALYDGKPVPKVIDFGVAKATHQKLTEKTMFTEVGQIVGTLEYMAPEQAELNNLDIDTRADIYSLGVMLYETLTGAPPLAPKEVRGQAFLEMLRMIREVEPSKPSTKISSSKHLPSIAAKRKLEPKSLERMMRGDLDWIVMKCLEKERARRYETANQLAEELRRYLRDEPVEAGPPSFGYRAKKFLRRNKGPVIAAALVVLALVGGMIGTSIGFVAAQQATSAERTAKLAAQESEASEKEAKLEETKAKLKAQASEAKEKDARLAAEISEAKEKETAKREKAIAEKERQTSAVAIGRLKQIEKVNAFLQSIFTDINPRLAEKGGPLLTEQLTKRLVEVADSLDEAAIGDPLTVARLQNFLGHTLVSLGEPGKAIDLYVKASATHQKLLGPDDPETLKSMGNLAFGYQAAGKLDLALPIFGDTVGRMKDKLGLDHPDTLENMNNLATGQMAAGKMELALPLFKETLKLRKAKLGPDHPDTLGSMNNLASAYQIAGELDLAIALFEDTRKRMVDNLGPDHPDTLASMNNLAFAYQAADKLDLALPLFEDTLERLKAKLGPDHPATLNGMNNLALGYQTAGKFELALPLFDDALKRKRAKLGPDHLDTLASMSSLAGYYQAVGKFDLALPRFDDTFRRLKAKLGPDHPDTLSAMNNLATCYRVAGKLDAALPLLKETLDLRKAKLRPDHPDTLMSMNNLATGYRSAGKLDLALPLFDETLQRRKATLGPDHPDTLSSMNNLATCYRVANKLDLALPLYDDTLKRRKAKLGPEHRDTLTSMYNLASCFQADGKLDLALPLFEDALKFRKAKFGTDHADTLLTMGNLAAAYLTVKEHAKAVSLFNEYLSVRRKQWGAGDIRYGGQLALVALELLRNGQFASAEPMLRDCLEIRTKEQPELWSTFNTRAVLGACLLGQKKYKDAEPLLKDGYEGMKQREKSIPPQGLPRLTEALERLVQLYEATDNTVEAERFRKELAERRASEKTPKK